MKKGKIVFPRTASVGCYNMSRELELEKLLAVHLWSTLSINKTNNQITMTASL